MDVGRVPSSNVGEGAGHPAISEFSLPNHDGEFSSEAPVFYYQGTLFVNTSC